jgi:hypothetical protein
MWDAIETLAKDAGESANAYIILVLDQYLQAQIENGGLKMDEKSETDIKLVKEDEKTAS